MDKSKSIELILKALKYDDDNNTEQFWNIIDKIEITDLMLAQTINYLINHGMIEGSKQDIGMKDEVSFVDGLSITPKGIRYLKEHSISKRIYSGLKEVVGWIK